MASTGPRNGIKSNWGLGYNGWDEDMDDNLLFIERFGVHLSVKDRDLATPPGSPSNGDTYIIAASATGAWSGKAAGTLTMYSTDGTPAWIFATPREGMLAYIEDEQKLSVYKASGSAWSAGVAI